MNGGMITVTVDAGVVTGQTTNAGNLAASATQNYDTLAPNAPFIYNLDGYLNAVERDAGFLILGLVDEPDLRVSVCILDAFPGRPCASANLRNTAMNGTLWLYPMTGR